MIATGLLVTLAASGCAFQGINSLRLPGAVGRGADAHIYRIELANVSTLESNSPVLIDDVIVGSVGTMTVRDWHAVVEVSVSPDVVVPANAIATVGQTSLLGSMHISLGAPLGEDPQGVLAPGSTIALDQSSTYPTTEDTLSSLSVVVNNGGLGQIGEVIHTFNEALDGRQSDFRELIGRLDDFVGTVDSQRDNIVASIEALNRLATTFADQNDDMERVLQTLPAALDVLLRERPNLTDALDSLRVFSDTTTGLISDTQDDLVANLRNLEPTIKALADIGPKLTTVLAYAPFFPYAQSFIDRAVRGDYLNLFVALDLTIPRLKRTLFLGTRWGDPDAILVPAPGEPIHQTYTYDPLGAAIQPPPPSEAGPADDSDATGTPDLPPTPVQDPGPAPAEQVAPSAANGAAPAGPAEGN